MPQTEIDISCPGCNAVFSVPVELCGEVAECTECSAVFEIPRLDEVPPTLNADSGAIKGILAPTPPPADSGNYDGTATNTVKLSRTSIGMIPSMKDTFTSGQNVPGKTDAASLFSAAPPRQPLAPPPQQVPTTPVATPSQQRSFAAPAATPAPSAPAPAAAQPPQQRPVAPAQTKLTFTRPPSQPPPAKPLPTPAAPPPSAQPAASPQQSATQTSLSTQQHQTAQAVKLPPWTEIQLKQGEEVQACREINKNPGLTALLVSLPVLLTIAAIFFAKTQLSLAIVIVIILWIATFVIALLMTKDNSKRAIVITSQRTVCIIGKDRIELKK